MASGERQTNKSRRNYDDDDDDRGNEMSVWQGKDVIVMEMNE